MVDKYQIVCIAFLPSFNSSQINIISHKKQRSGSLKVCAITRGLCYWQMVFQQSTPQLASDTLKTAFYSCVGIP